MDRVVFVERVYRAGISTNVYEGRFSNPYVMEKRRGMSTFQDRFPSCLKKKGVSSFPVYGV